MQSFTGLKILIVGAGVVFSGAGSVAEAAPIHQFDVGYGWDGAFAYGQAETPPSSETPQARDSVVDTLDVSAVAPRKAATVPVPGALALFGSGLVLLAVAGHRSRRRTSVAH